MRIVFIGTVHFSLAMLQQLIASKANVVAVVTKKQSLQNADFADLSGLCHKAKIPVRYVENINDQNHIDWMASFKPDIMFCFGFSQIINKNILEIAPRGVVGYHPAELPQNRGRHPLIWALVLGLKQTASTFFMMDEGADSGDIISQKRILIQGNDDAASLYDKVVRTAKTQLKALMPQLKNKTVVYKKQNHRLATYWRKRSKEDGQIDFRMSARAIHCLVRALNKPYPGAHVVFNGQDIKIWQVKEMKSQLKNSEPGKVLKIQRRSILVKCFDEAILITQHDFKNLPAQGDYLR